MRAFIQSLDLPEADRQRLLAMTPASYTGLASELASGILPMRLLLNIDVPDLAAARRFYVEAYGLRDGRRLGDGVLELLGAQAPIYLLQKPTGSLGTGDQPRTYARHWTPVHVDVVVDDLDTALARALDAGARQE